MKKLSGTLKFILIDTAGILLIILAGLTSWIPGPGGIPLLIAGLGLLSINHDWAKRWLDTVRKHGLHLSEKLFNGSKKTNLIIDIVGLLCITGAVLLVLLFTKTIAKSAAVWLIIIAAILLLGNRKRLKNLLKKH